MAPKRKWQAGLVVAALLLAFACEEEGHRKTEMLAKKANMRAWFNHPPVYGVTADLQNPGKRYWVCDEASGVCIIVTV